jgi:hypothetical protein
VALHGPPGPYPSWGAILWALMMLVWLAGLLYGLWWVWPHFERMTLSADLVMASNP